MAKRGASLNSTTWREHTAAEASIAVCVYSEASPRAARRLCGDARVQAVHVYTGTNYGPREQEHAVAVL